MSEWQKIETHTFPWKPYELVVAVYAKDDPSEIEVFICDCADHGSYYRKGSMLNLYEEGWVPYAWTNSPPSLPPSPEITHERE